MWDWRRGGLIFWNGSFWHLISVGGFNINLWLRDEMDGWVGDVKG